MKTTTFVSALAAMASVATAATKPSLTTRQKAHRTRSLPQISVSGNAFWADGERFFVRGIDYQPGGASENEDPLADPEVCARDIERFETLGVNAIRVYSLENNQNHDECMDMLADAGIYLMADVNSPLYSITRENPADSYNAAYLQSVFATVEEFAKYDNTMLFFSGNEVIDDENNTDTAPYVKATTRDIKNYMRVQGLRPIPVGYSAADVSVNRMQQAAYFNCGSDDARSDFFAFNDYSWCNTDFLRAGWDQKVENFTDYGIPIFLSEFGCLSNGERQFGEIESLMHSNMTSIYSGGMMYEYTMEKNNYGIVEIEDGEAEELDEFYNLASAYSRWPAPTDDGNPRFSTTTSVACPTKDSDWDVEPDLLPVMPSEAVKYMEDGVRDGGPGLKGPGSQEDTDSGTASVSTTSGEPSPTGETRENSRESVNGGSEGGDDSAAASVIFESGFLVVTGLTALFAIGGTFLL